MTQEPLARLGQLALSERLVQRDLLVRRELLELQAQPVLQDRLVQWDCKDLQV